MAAAPVFQRRDQPSLHDNAIMSAQDVLAAVNRPMPPSCGGGGFGTLDFCHRLQAMTGVSLADCVGGVSGLEQRLGTGNKNSF